MTKVIGVRFKEGGKIYFFAPGDFEIEKNEYVVVDTSRGLECGLVVQGIHDEEDSSIVAPLKEVLRKATAEDLAKLVQNRTDETKAFEICSEKIIKHGLVMKLVDVEYTFDRSKILFYYTADGRVDFRELVKELASIFRTRIEMRQIGVRDESKMIGGIGVCGQPFCCARFLKDFVPVGIRMAKDQGLSLNPTKINGSCGRLMCCLSYEQNVYEYLNSVTPARGSYVRTPDGTGTVTEVTNILSGSIKVRLDREKESAPADYRAEDVEVLRWAGKRG